MKSSYKKVLGKAYKSHFTAAGQASKKSKTEREIQNLYDNIMLPSLRSKKRKAS